MQILPLHPLLAAEIRDFSLDQFEESDWTQIIESLKKYSVLVFRNQEIDNEAQIRFSERLGPLETTKVGTEGAGTKLVFLTNMDSKENSFRLPAGPSSTTVPINSGTPTVPSKRFPPVPRFLGQ